MPHAEQAWPGVAANVAEARRFVRRMLAKWGAEELEWPASALVSELTTNAVLHAGTTFAVALTLDDEGLRLEVKDGSPAHPVVRHYDDDATTGRGLRLVVQLAEQWGVEPRSTSKTVWCVLTVRAPTSAAPDPGEEVDVDALLAQFSDAEPGAAQTQTASTGGAHTQNAA